MSVQESFEAWYDAYGTQAKKGRYFQALRTPHYVLDDRAGNPVPGYSQHIDRSIFPRSSIYEWIDLQRIRSLFEETPKDKVADDGSMHTAIGNYALWLRLRCDNPKWVNEPLWEGDDVPLGSGAKSRIKTLNSNGFDFHSEWELRKKVYMFDKFLAAIRTKPFILLAGISGTGKSRMVRQLARGFCPKMGEATSEQPVRGAWVPDVPKMKAAWDAFLEKWPFEKLSTLTLEEYSAVGKKDSFCYDLEHKATVGSIKGNTSFKFGIYEYGQMPKAQKGQKADDRYAWYEKHGATREEAWENIRKIIVDVATAAREGKVSDVDAADLAPMVKWKIAFLYQDQNKPQVLNYFSPDVVKNMTAALGDNEPMSRRYEHLLAQRSADVNLLQYGADCYNQFLANEQAESKSTGASSVSTSQTDAWNFLLIPVRPNWHDSTELLGYVSRVSGKPEYVVKDFVKFLVKAWMYPKVPFFLCLDEMNLAPVEQYFAEYLSVIETRQKDGEAIVTDPIVQFEDAVFEQAFRDLLEPYAEVLQSGTEDEKAALEALTNQMQTSHALSIPQNLVVIGTVNMDETTFSFSRKVLDRAMSFELNEVNMREGLTAPTKMPLGAFKYDGSPLQRYIEADEVYPSNKDLCDKVLGYLETVNEKLDKTPFKIAYRSRNEIMVYCVERTKDGAVSLEQALDEATSMKILSRIEGDRRRLRVDNTRTLLDVLNETIESKLKELHGDGELPTHICRDKLEEMKTQLEGGYTSFWTR